MTDALTLDRERFLSRFDVSRETLERLDQIVDTLDAWRETHNLIGPKEWPLIWTRHVGDSFRLVELLAAHRRIVDLGSGAGFPGLVIAAAKPDGQVTMIESVGKKCAFLRAAIAAAGLSASVHQSRVEATRPEPADAVTARAFAPLPELLTYAAPWLQKGATGYFFKGERWKEELTKAQETWSFVYEATSDRHGGSGVILIVRELTHAGR
jgi:16S rRNA (guanine527-N7)-methyltransferase